MIEINNKRKKKLAIILRDLSLVSFILFWIFSYLKWTSYQQTEIFFKNILIFESFIIFISLSIILDAKFFRKTRTKKNLQIILLTEIMILAFTKIEIIKNDFLIFMKIPLIALTLVTFFLVSVSKKSQNSKKSKDGFYILSVFLFCLSLFIAHPLGLNSQEVGWGIFYISLIIFIWKSFLK